MRGNSGKIVNNNGYPMDLPSKNTNWKLIKRVEWERPFCKNSNNWENINKNTFK
jgi:hypothetical protein